MVAGLVEASLLKGLIAGMLGLVVTVLGNDPMMGVPRLTFGIPFLEGGVDFLPVLIGVFAFAQIMSDAEKMGGTAAHRARRSAPLRCSPCRTEGDLGNPVAAVPAAMDLVHRRLDRRAAGDRRQRGKHDGLRPGEEVLASARRNSAPAFPRASSPPKPRTTPTSAARSSRSWRSAFPAMR